MSMPFGVLIGVGRGIGNWYIRWGGYRRRGRGSFGVEFGASHCNGDFATRLFPNYFGQYLLFKFLCGKHSCNYKR